MESVELGGGEQSDGGGVGSCAGLGSGDGSLGCVGPLSHVAMQLGGEWLLSSGWSGRRVLGAPCGAGAGWARVAEGEGARGW